MFALVLRSFKRCAGALMLPVILGWLAGSAGAQDQGRRSAAREDDLSLVRVNITTETLGAGEPVVINGKRISGYQPKIIHVFPSTGVVMDDSNHVLTFLGYRWVDLHQSDPRVDILTTRGEQFKGKLVGIDQALGVAVVRSLAGKLSRSLICRNCEIRGGDTVVAPILEQTGESQFLRAQVLSVGEGRATSASGLWMITMNRRLPGIGEPLLDTERRVLGFAASQQPSREDPMGMRTVAYPIAELLASAEKILQAGGDIRNGWLGVYLDETQRPPSAGVKIKDVMGESPAQKAGLRPQDLIVKWNGEEIRDARQFIRMVQESRVGSNVSMDILRGGKPATLQAVIQTRRPAENPGRFVFNFPDVMQTTEAVEGTDSAAFRAGIETTTLTPQLADFMQIPGQSGLLVLNVDASMAFSRAGVQAGDIILAVDGQRVDSPQTFFSQLKARSRSAQQVMLKLLRRGTERSVTLPASFGQPRPPNK